MAASVPPAFVKSIPDHSSARFHHRLCEERGPQKVRRSGRGSATGAFAADGINFDQ